MWLRRRQVGPPAHRHRSSTVPQGTNALCAAPCARWSVGCRAHAIRVYAAGEAARWIATMHARAHDSFGTCGPPAMCGIRSARRPHGLVSPPQGTDSIQGCASQASGNAMLPLTSPQSMPTRSCKRNASEPPPTHNAALGRRPRARPDRRTGSVATRSAAPVMPPRSPGRRPMAVRRCGRCVGGGRRVPSGSRPPYEPGGGALTKGAAAPSLWRCRDAGWAGGVPG